MKPTKKRNYYISRHSLINLCDFFELPSSINNLLSFCNKIIFHRFNFNDKNAFKGIVTLKILYIFLIYSISHISIGQLLSFHRISSSIISHLSQNTILYGPSMEAGQAKQASQWLLFNIAHKK